MKIIWLVFSAIFIAELGDKTQLAILAMKSKGWSGIHIFSGAMLAFAVLTALAIFFGDLLYARLPMGVIEKIAAISFIIIGILMWFEIV